MSELLEALARAFNEQTYKCVLSGPRGGGGELRRAVLNYAEQQGWQLERHTDTQVFHERLSFVGALEYISNALGEGVFAMLNSWDLSREHSVKISKKGKVLSQSRPLGPDAPEARQGGHNREKKYILPRGELIAPLVDMGIFTADGKVVSSMYDKYKQINRFLEIIDDEVGRLNVKKLTVLDFGCGKSYLTFVLYHYLTKIRGIDARVTGLDLKADVVEKCNTAASRYGYSGLEFHVGDIAGWQAGYSPDIVITLHACDTATDYALFSAIRWGARLIFSVPCCQHELNSQIKSERLALLMRYGIIKERFAALATDAIRASLLEHCGYKAQMLEFVDFAHTPKNILIRAAKRGRPSPSALAEAEAVMREFGARPTLYRLLQDAGMLAPRAQNEDE